MDELSYILKMANELHIENGVTCVFDKKHYSDLLSTSTLSRQKNYRASAGIWITVRAMAKFQAVEEFKTITNQNKMLIAMAQKCGVTLTMNDLTREIAALETFNVAQTEAVAPVLAVADKTDATNVWIGEQFQAGKSEQEIIASLKSQKWTDEQLKPYFKSMQEVAPVGIPPPPN